MASNRFYQVAQLSDDTTKQLASSAEEWKKFLVTASRMYRYQFEDQLLIHIQRPDATAAANIDIWNKRMGCWIKRGAKGIALIEDRKKHRLRYIFDVKDVRVLKNGHLPELWVYKEAYGRQVVERLEKTYGKTDDSKDFAFRIKQIARSIAEDYADTVMEYLGEDMSASKINGYSEADRRQIAEDTMTAGISYLIFSRCGLDAEQLTSDLNFNGITEFNTIDSIQCSDESRRLRHGAHRMGEIHHPQQD